MKNFKRFFAAFFVALLLVSLSACAPNLAVSTVTPTPEPTLTAASTATPTLSPEPMPTLSPIEQKEAEINQEIQSFLNAEGIYQDYKMDLGALRPQDSTTIEAVDLGIISCGLVIQGCLLDYIEKGDYYFLIFGFENNDNKRFVSLLGIPKYFYEGRESYFDIFQTAWAGGTDPVVSNYSHDVMIEYLSKLKGKVCGFPPYYQNLTEKYFRDHGWKYDWVPRYVEEVNNSIGFAKRLLNTVSTNDIAHWSLPIDPEVVGIWRASRKSEPIVGLNEIDYESLNGLEVPFIRFALYCKNINSN